MMKMVFLTALGVGGATVFGSLVAFTFKGISRRCADGVMSFAAGVMLAAAIIGLILPSIEYGGPWGVLVTVLGIFAGAVCLNVIDKMIPPLHRLAESNLRECDTAGIDRTLLFVTAIAIHNLPEGLATGVSFGTDDISQALMIAFGIALQNVPEGMVIIGPMLAVGISPRKTFICAMGTGLIEVLGTLIGYWAVSAAAVILPFALAFAGGTMLYVICDEMIPETRARSDGTGATYALLAGACVMLICDALIG